VIGHLEIASQVLEVAMGCPVVHFEIGCRDKARTEEFFRTLFGWTMTAGGPALMIDTGAGSGINGHITSLGHEPHHYTLLYVEVDDIPAYLAKAESLGGKTLVPPVTIPTGTFAWFADPDGTTVGLWTPKQG
jgi:predicted enzyme related to lactoylglutathione lyase